MCFNFLYPMKNLGVYPSEIFRVIFILLYHKRNMYLISIYYYSCIAIFAKRAPSVGTQSLITVTKYL